MTTLREQIEALGTIGSPLKVYRSDVLDIIDAHEQEDAALWGRLAYLEKWKDDRHQDALWAEERDDPV